MANFTFDSCYAVATNKEYEFCPEHIVQFCT